MDEFNEDDITIDDPVFDMEPVVQKPSEIHGVIAEGVYNVEHSLFGQCDILRKRIDRLTRIIDDLEESIMSEQNIATMEPSEKIKFYKLYSRINGELMQHMKDLHNMVADLAKFDAIKTMMDDGARKLETARTKLTDPRVQKALNVISQMIEEKSKT